MFISTSLLCCLLLAVDIVGPPWPFPSVPDILSCRLSHPKCFTLRCSRTSHRQQLRTPECLTFGCSTTCGLGLLSRISSVDPYLAWRRLSISSFGTHSDSLGCAWTRSEHRAYHARWSTASLVAIQASGT